MVKKNLPAMQETWVQSLGQEYPLERGIATHSSILAWRIPCTEEPGSPRGCKRVRAIMLVMEEQESGDTLKEKWQLVENLINKTEYG